jgi:hypothetical protein
MTCEDGADLMEVAFVAFAPAVISFFGAVAGAWVADGLVRATTSRELLAWLANFIIIWLMIPTLQAAVASYASRIDICDRRARRLAPWLLATGFATSLASIPFYSPFLSLFKEGWRQLTEFTYFAPMLATYAVTSSRLMYRD